MLNSFVEGGSMSIFIAETTSVELWPRRLLAGIVLGVTLVQLLIPIARVLYQSRPRRGALGTEPQPESRGFLAWFADSTTKAWGASPDWIPVFMVANAFALTFSLQGVLNAGEARPQFLETLLEDSLLCSQVAALLLSISLISAPITRDRHAVRPFDEARGFWMSALGFAICSNLVALHDTATRDGVGTLKRSIWAAENLATTMFYAVPLWLLLGKRFETLKDQKMSKLWKLVGLLLILVGLDCGIPKEW